MKLYVFLQYNNYRLYYSHYLISKLRSYSSNEPKCVDVSLHFHVKQPGPFSETLCYFLFGAQVQNIRNSECKPSSELRIIQSEHDVKYHWQICWSEAVQNSKAICFYWISCISNVKDTSNMLYIHATFKVTPPETTNYGYLCLNSCINLVYRTVIRGGLSLVPFLCYFVLTPFTWKYVT
jgi:hypothetical protein